jgi:hypothetical protein
MTLLGPIRTPSGGVDCGLGLVLRPPHSTRAPAIRHPNPPLPSPLCRVACVDTSRIAADKGRVALLRFEFLVVWPASRYARRENIHSSTRGEGGALLQHCPLFPISFPFPSDRSLHSRSASHSPAPSIIPTALDHHGKLVATIRWSRSGKQGTLSRTFTLLRAAKDAIIDLLNLCVNYANGKNRSLAARSRMQPSAPRTASLSC